MVYLFYLKYLPFVLSITWYSLSYLHLKVNLEKYELTERKMIGFFLMYFSTN